MSHRTLPKLGANQIIYISCNPSATLARDAKDLIALGYALKKTTPFEMFPMTYHSKPYAHSKMKT
ncbi:MAG: hypothetical protein R3A45_12715 [Bdellovibrionota bacterium]